MSSAALAKPSSSPWRARRTRGPFQPPPTALAEIHARDGADSVVFEVSGCEVIDLDEFVELQKVVRTMEWLGVRCVIAGSETWYRCLSCRGRHLGRIASHFTRSGACLAGAQSS